jgi:hypothetical protein
MDPLFLLLSVHSTLGIPSMTTQHHIYAERRATISAWKFDMGERQLPSWVVDWPSAAMVLYRSEDTYPYPRPQYGKFHNLSLRHLDQFRRDNMQNDLAYKKLCIRGTVDPRFCIQDGFISSRKKFRPDKQIWSFLYPIIFGTDLVVYVPAFSNSDAEEIPEEEFSRLGPWVLRPTGNNEFRLVACLTTGDLYPFDTDKNLPYSHYHAGLDSNDQVRSFYTKALFWTKDTEYKYTPPGRERTLDDLREFIIV